MREGDRKRAEMLSQRLVRFDQDRYALPGLSTDAHRSSLVRQMIDSLHRIEYVQRLGDRDLSPLRADPNSQLFDPLKAAVLHLKQGDPDEAGWLVFISTHFGFHGAMGWESTRSVYGALGVGAPWTWARVSANPEAFRAWFVANAHELGNIVFGNHRKYESTRADVSQNLADTVSSYVEWVGRNRGHQILFQEISHAHGGDARATFEALYKSMKVARFGRTAKFDYLTMMGKLGIWDIDPPHPYFGAATGPVSGAKLLFSGSKDGDIRRSRLSEMVVELGDFLGVNMQVMEDSLCNWQKSPAQYVAFRG